MDENNGGLNRLCKVYQNLDTEGKERVIRLAEELLKTQKEKKEKNDVRTRN